MDGAELDEDEGEQITDGVGGEYQCGTAVGSAKGVVDADQHHVGLFEDFKDQIGGATVCREKGGHSGGDCFHENVLSDKG